MRFLLGVQPVAPLEHCRMWAEGNGGAGVLESAGPSSVLEGSFFRAGGFVLPAGVNLSVG